MQKVNVGLILTTFNQLDKTKQALERLYRSTHHPFELLVVDNNSTDGTLNYLHAMHIPIITNKKDTSLAIALNQGLKYYLNKPVISYIGWIHNDMLFFSGWLEALLNVLQNNKSIGKLSPYNWWDNSQQDDFKNAEAFMRNNQNILFPGNGCPWIMPRHVIEEVGFFDKYYKRCGGYEDWDYNNRISAKGYQVMITKASVVWHEAMGTRKYIEQSKASRHNAAYYAKKWGSLKSI